MTQRHTFTNAGCARWGEVLRPIGCGGFRVLALMTFVFCFVFSCTVNLLNVEVDGKSVARVPTTQFSVTPLTYCFGDATTQPVDDDVQLMTQEAVADSVMDYVVGDLVHQLQTASPKPHVSSPKTKATGLSQ